jgi:hypothetical protein
MKNSNRRVWVSGVGFRVPWFRDEEQQSEGLGLGFLECMYLRHSALNCASCSGRPAMKTLVMGSGKAACFRVVGF